MGDPIKPKVTFQLLSDLHLERKPLTYDTLHIPKKAEYLILAGDIGSVCKSTHIPQLTAWFVRECVKFTRVFWIAGNNEFKSDRSSRMTIIDGLRRMTAIADDPRMENRLIVLNNRHYDLRLEGRTIAIMGSTLWSHIRAHQPDSIGADRDIRFDSIETHNRWYAIAIAALRKSVSEIRMARPGRESRNILVVTHHAPAIRDTSAPAFEAPENNRWSAYQHDILGGRGCRD